MSHQVKNTVSAFEVSSKLLFFTLKNSKIQKIDDQCSSVTKGSICHIKHMYIQPFATEVD